MKIQEEPSDLGGESELSESKSTSGLDGVIIALNTALWERGTQRQKFHQSSRPRRGQKRKRGAN